MDGHGDLRLEHLFFEGQEDRMPTIIDCVEFNDNFRILDAAEDVISAC